MIKVGYKERRLVTNHMAYNTVLLLRLSEREKGVGWGEGMQRKEKGGEGRLRG